MTWEQTIECIRQDPAFADLVRDAYYESNLSANVERFRTGEEFKATISLIESIMPEATVVADIGSGNGMATLAWALSDYYVYSVEPDPSSTVGAGAIRRLLIDYNLHDKISVIESYGEDTSLPDELVDIVYIRQAMHHARDLERMMRECYRILRKGGVLLTARDHVIFDDNDKTLFLKAHPLHKYYGGENAYTETQYLDAITKAGFQDIKILRFYDSVINFFPLSEQDVSNMLKEKKNRIISSLRKRIGLLASFPLMQTFYLKYIKFDPSNVYNEKAVPGRLYTFIARKIV
jgi:SAM-dependent methyltransferase